MAGRKRSTLGDMVGSSAPKRFRTEGVHDSHKQHMDAVAKATNDTPSDKQLISAVSEQKSAIDKEEKPHEVDATTALPSSAASKALHTTELLEQILSYLSAPDLIAATNHTTSAAMLPDPARNIAWSRESVNSSIAQSKLFLRPSGREKDIWLHCEFYAPRRRCRGRMSPPTKETPIVAQSFECTTEAYHEMLRTAKGGGTAKCVSIVTLCPLLELEDTQEPTALGRLKRKGWRDSERANLIGLPAENTKYADMVLTDPPVDEVDVILTYKHSSMPLLMIRFNRHVTSKIGPLTFSAVLADACAQ